MLTPTSLPKDFEEKIKVRLGQEFDDFILSLQQPAPVSIRLNPKKINSIETKAAVPWSIYGRYLAERPSFTRDPAFHGGSYYVQEASSMFLEQIIKQVNNNEQLVVLDLCAAPGGKSTHLLSLLSDNCLLVSNEVIRSRATILAENIQKWGYPNVIVTNNDPADFASLEGLFDIILVDAPCSGEGLFRKDPNAISEWSSNNVDLCSKRQQRIISDIWPALKENGTLVYCTCTYNEKENQEIINWIQSRHHVESIKIPLNDNWNIEHIMEKNIDGYHFYPHKVQGEGFFISAIRKIENTNPFHSKIKKSPAFTHQKIKSQLNSWVLSSAEMTFYQWNDRVYFAPQCLTDLIQVLSNRLKVIIIGTNAATIKHEKLIPEHALALSTCINITNFNILSLSLEEALTYLKKDALQISYPAKGFALVTYNNIPIGWVNALGNRLNNLYPKEWRIRMAI